LKIVSQTDEAFARVTWDGERGLRSTILLLNRTILPLRIHYHSGSAVLDTQNHVIGLLFAGSDLATLINPIEPVLESLGVEIVT